MNGFGWLQLQQNHESFHNSWNCKEITDTLALEEKKWTSYRAQIRLIKCEFFFVCLFNSCILQGQLAMDKKSQFSVWVPGVPLAQSRVCNPWLAVHNLLSPSFSKLWARSVISYILPCYKEVRVKGDTWAEARVTGTLHHESPSQIPIAHTPLGGTTFSSRFVDSSWYQAIR